MHTNRLLFLLKLVVCILLRVLGQVQGFRLTQHCFWIFYLITATCVALDGNPERSLFSLLLSFSIIEQLSFAAQFY
jgi:hypothetical protein